MTWLDFSLAWGAATAVTWVLLTINTRPVNRNGWLWLLALAFPLTLVAVLVAYTPAKAGQ